MMPFQKLQVSCSYLLAVTMVFNITLIGGCECILEAKINLSELQSKKNKIGKAHLLVSTPECLSFEHAKKPSQHLLEIQQTIPFIFPNAQYITCHPDHFSAIAHFSLPLAIEKKINSNDQKNDPDNIQFTTHHEQFLTISLPTTIRDNLILVKDKSYTLTTIDIKAKLIITNNTNELYQLHILSAYVNDAPIIEALYLLKQGDTVTIELSNVSVDQLLTTGSATIIQAATLIKNLK